MTESLTPPALSAFIFDIDISKILLIVGLALVVLSTDKLSGVARTLGRWPGRARAMARQFRDQLEAEADNLNLGRNSPTQAPPLHLTPWQLIRCRYRCRWAAKILEIPTNPRNTRSRGQEYLNLAAHIQDFYRMASCLLPTNKPHQARALRWAHHNDPVVRLTPAFT